MVPVRDLGAGVQVELIGTERLWFGPGDPVRAASAVSPFGDGWLIAQDDANHAAALVPAWTRRDRDRLGEHRPASA
jgi:hypothetical protein